MYCSLALFTGKLSGGPPKVIRFTRPQIQRVKAGENVTFDCLEIISVTLPDVRWFHLYNKKDHSILPDIPKNIDWDRINRKHYPFDSEYIPVYKYETFRLKSSHHKPRNDFIVDNTDPSGLRLTLYNVSTVDTGYYACFVSNFEGSDYATFSLIVN